MDTALTIAVGAVLVVLIAAGLAAASAPSRARRHSDDTTLTEAGQAEKRIRAKLYGGRVDQGHRDSRREDGGQGRR